MTQERRRKPWELFTALITLAAMLGGMIYQEGQVKQSVDDLSLRITRIENRLDRYAAASWSKP